MIVPPDKVAGLVLEEADFRRYQRLINAPIWRATLDRLANERYADAKRLLGNDWEDAQSSFCRVARRINLIEGKRPLGKPLKFALSYALYLHVEMMVAVRVEGETAWS